MTDYNGNGDWNSWSKYVLKALEESNKKHEKANLLLTEIQVEIAHLEEKAERGGALYGFLTGGVISLIIGLILKLAI
jgi:hypothetical protein